MPHPLRSRLILSLIALFCVGPVTAANIVILNGDGPGEGFNDPTPVAPVGGNTGTTLGEQRLNVFTDAAGVWGAYLDSSVTIVVEANFDPLTCTSSQAVLGSAGPETIHRNFANAPASNTYYPAALANSLAGSDLNGSTPDISVTFNSSIDNNNNCLNNTNWYYGIDGNKPGGTIELRSVVLHELGHGLGFVTFVDLNSGARFFNRDDTFMLNLEDHSLGLTWSGMSDAQRAASAKDNGDLHWIGNQVTVNSGGLTAGIRNGHVRMYAPTTLVSGSSVSHFDSALAPNELMEPSNIGVHSAPGLAVPLMGDIGWTVLTPPNTVPTITAIADQTIDEDTTSAAIGFSIDDQETLATNLQVTASSADSTIVQNSGLVLSGSGANRQLTVTPVADAHGTVSITVTVSDGELSADALFLLTVNAVNDQAAVTINSPADGAVYGESAAINFSGTATDVEDGNLSANLQWSSDIDGILGTGANLVSSLSQAQHVVTTSVTDSGGIMAFDQINVTVNPDWDMDGDGMADAWEMARFGTLARDGSGDYDNDGVSDLEEYEAYAAARTGDINNDGSIDAGDLVLAQRHILGLIVLSPEQIDRGDLYPTDVGDGVLNMSDLILLQQVVLN